jgi:hypothetical protein
LSLTFDAHRNNGEDGDDEFGSDTGASADPTDEAVKIKVLDRIAEMLSRSKRWRNVTVTGLREFEDHVVVDVVRNAGFAGDGADLFYMNRLEDFMRLQG